MMDIEKQMHESNEIVLELNDLIRSHLRKRLSGTDHENIASIVMTVYTNLGINLCSIALGAPMSDDQKDTILELIMCSIVERSKDIQSNIEAEMLIERAKRM